MISPETISAACLKRRPLRDGDLHRRRLGAPEQRGDEDVVGLVHVEGVGARHEPGGVAVRLGADLEGAGVLDHALPLQLGGDGAQARALLDDHGDRAADLAVGEVGARVADAGADHEREDRDEQVAEEAAAMPAGAAVLVPRAAPPPDARDRRPRRTTPGGS